MYVNKVFSKFISSWEKYFKEKQNTRYMGFFSKEIIVGDTCPKCNMKFSDSERTLRHMKKAHSTKKKFDCNTCGFRN